MLIHDLDSRDTAEAYHSFTLQSEWQSVDMLMDFVPPKSLCVGFNHNAIPSTSFTDYALAAGFVEFQLRNADLQGSCASFKELPPSDVSRHKIAFLQSWLYLLEPI